MTLGLNLPWRRRSRWDRIKGTVTSRKELRRRMKDARRLRDALPDAGRVRNVLPDTGQIRSALPDPSELVQRVQPLVSRVASARPDVSMPEPPAFLKERLPLDRLSTLGRKQPSAPERILNAEAPLWLAIGLALGGLMLGFALGQAAAARRVPGVDPAQLEAAADKIKDQWPAIHDDDIREAQGNLKRLSSVVAERTGENARDVRERLTTMTSGQSSNGHS